MKILCYRKTAIEVGSLLAAIYKFLLMSLSLRILISFCNPLRFFSAWVSSFMPLHAFWMKTLALTSLLTLLLVLVLYDIIMIYDIVIISHHLFDSEPKYY